MSIPFPILRQPRTLRLPYSSIEGLTLLDPRQTLNKQYGASLVLCAARVWEHTLDRC